MRVKPLSSRWKRHPHDYLLRRNANPVEWEAYCQRKGFKTGRSDTLEQIETFCRKHKISFDPITGQIWPVWEFYRLPYQIYHVPSGHMVYVEDSYDDYQAYLRVISLMLDMGVKVVDSLPHKLVVKLFSDEGPCYYTDST